MRVLFGYKDYWPVRGGIEGMVRALATGLRREYGVATMVLATNTGRRSWRGAIDGVPVWKVGRLATLARAPIAPGLLHAYRRLPVDVADLQFPYPVGEVAYLLAGRARRLVVTYHSDIVRQRALAIAYRPWLEWLLRRADAIVATSAPYVDSSPVLARFREKVRVIPFGIDPARFASPDPVRVADLRARHGDRVILFVGLYRYYKGLEFLLAALPAVDPAARLVLVGQGIRAALAEPVRQAGLADRVVFAGEVDDAELAAHYAAADVFCLPSSHRSEAFGIVLLEAMAAGLPLVSTELGTGTSWINQAGSTGVVVPPRDPAALTRALNGLLSDPTLRARFGAAARARLDAEFTLAHLLHRRHSLNLDLLRG